MDRYVVSYPHCKPCTTWLWQYCICTYLSTWQQRKFEFEHLRKSKRGRIRKSNGATVKKPKPKTIKGRVKKVEGVHLWQHNDKLFCRGQVEVWKECHDGPLPLFLPHYFSIWWSLVLVFFHMLLCLFDFNWPQSGLQEHRGWHIPCACLCVVLAHARSHVMADWAVVMSVKIRMLEVYTSAYFAHSEKIL